MFGKKQNEENQPFSTLALKTHAGNTVSKKRRKCAIWFNTYFSIFKQPRFLAFGINSVNSIIPPNYTFFPSNSLLCSVLYLYSMRQLCCNQESRIHTSKLPNTAASQCHTMC